MSGPSPIKIAIHPDLVRLKDGRQASLSRRWIELAEAAGVQIRLVDALAPDALEAIRPCDGFVWHFAPDRRAVAAARQLLFTLEQGTTLPSYPDWRSAWHFADSAAQAAVLDAARIPTVPTWTFWTEGDALDFCRDATFPLRLRSSHDDGERDRLLHDPREAADAVRQAFGTAAAGHGSWRSRIWRRSGNAVDDRQDGDRGQATFVLQEVLPASVATARLLIAGECAYLLEDVQPDTVDERLVALAFDVTAHLRAQSLAVDMALYQDAPLVTGMRYAPSTFPRQPIGHWRHTDLTWQTSVTRAEDVIFDLFLERIRTANA